MVNLNNPRNSSSITCFIDSDIIINWLAKEEDPLTHDNLWEAPFKIIKLAEAKKITAFTSLINLLEIRFVLRRKKDLNEEKIKTDISKILKLLEIAIPDEINLLKANSLQTDEPFSPFDALLVSTALSIPRTVLVSRDKNLLRLASKFLMATTPEEFLRALEK